MKMEIQNNVYYRYRDYLVSKGVDPETEASYGSHVELDCDEYKVLRTTPKGVWIELYDGQERFVRNDSRKKFAHPTQEEALDSFIARKERQISILAAQRRSAKEALIKASTLRMKGINDEAAEKLNYAKHCFEEIK